MRDTPDHPLEKYFRQGVNYTTCPGCGNGIISQSLLRAIDELDYDFDIIGERLRELAYLNKGLEISFKGTGEGQELDVSHLGSMIYLEAVAVMVRLLVGQELPRLSKSKAASTKTLTTLST